MLWILRGKPGNSCTFSWVFLILSPLALLEMDRGIGGAFDREFGRNEMGMSRNNFGDSFERGIGWYIEDFVI